MKIIVQFSGGKDSQACLIYACNQFGANNVTALFCDTGWEHELTYEHIHYVTECLGCKLVVIRNEHVDGMEGLCKRMKWFPDTMHRMCTMQLKIYPSIDYILSQDEDVLIIQGIRAGESAARSKLSCSADYFGAYKDPTNKKSLYHKTKVLDWCASHTATVERPFFGETGQYVIDYILNNGQKPNPLYRKGCSRVGCYPCIYAKLSELRILAKDDKYVQRVIQLENDVKRLREDVEKTPSSFFAKGKIPARYCKTYGNGIATFQEIVEYVSLKNVPTLFDDEENGESCMSMYHGLCE